MCKGTKWRMKGSHPGSDSNHLCGLGNHPHYPSYTSPYTSPKRKAHWPPAGGRGRGISTHLLFSMCLYYNAQLFSYLILFQEIISEHYAPAFAFFTLHWLPFWVMEIIISNKPQTIKLTHFSFCQITFSLCQAKVKVMDTFDNVILWLTGNWKVFRSKLFQKLCHLNLALDNIGSPLSRVVSENLFKRILCLRGDSDSTGICWEPIIYQDF